ncbi:MAG: ABC transporter substrate-binding protein [Bacteroidetes bacterium]|nr:ABC transporter substrate-binding protein [Rhodothermia bacterium]MCS7155424.1 ABC transporter substrate-binding protein [Bacteroidota bacterium]MCX7907483.1 ABC transporter substrate-binding protein [Bacteroidota bacterium]MDW8138477.1 ABC transporter substrate-binding protein [Bacteroidota bacterium]MDW8284586.1 ABC transporter substrate-binding protein [Bacteroidota bacterium]
MRWWRCAVFGRSALLVALSVFGLGPVITAGSGPPQGSRRGGVLTKHELNDPDGLHPYLTTDASTRYIQQLIFDRLCKLNLRTLELMPELAELPVAENGHRSYRFRLRPEARWADGRPVTAEDVVFSWKALMNPFVDSAPLRAECVDILKPEILGPREVRFYVRRPRFDNVYKLTYALYILPKHHYDPDGLTDRYTVEDLALYHSAGKLEELPQQARAAMEAFARRFQDPTFRFDPARVLGSGPYRPVQWRRGQWLVLARNERYWQAGSREPFSQAYPDTIRFRVLQDLEAAYGALRAGQIHFSESFRPVQLVRQMQGPDFERRFAKHVQIQPSFYYIAWNLDRVYFRDPRVRQALSLLADRHQMLRTVFFGQGRPTATFYFDQRPEHHPGIRPDPYDPARARRLLAEAGWSDTNGDGVLDKDGVPFRFTLYFNQGNENRRQVALIWAQALAQVGIQAVVQPIEWGALLGRLRSRDYDAAVVGIVFDANEQDFYPYFHSTQAEQRGFNYAGYRNPEADQLLERIPTELEPQRRIPLHRALQARLAADRPYLFLFVVAQRFVYDRRWSGVLFYPQRPGYYLGEWYLTPGVRADL